MRIEKVLSVLSHSKVFNWIDLAAQTTEVQLQLRILRQDEKLAAEPSRLPQKLYVQKKCVSLAFASSFGIFYCCIPNNSRFGSLISFNVDERGVRNLGTEK